ncbi:hypothetical protein L596_026353 [Steinernema carpocapsae]|uniref:Uncharacterized protein n=1 Tax=Steinernema carpocapsae TaxID=34508 RepID=A0A4U5M128_STECR|nr:hypothetical protein L596_026353 [Steinernema carpocapsae]
MEGLQPSQAFADQIQFETGPKKATSSVRSLDVHFNRQCKRFYRRLAKISSSCSKPPLENLSTSQICLAWNWLLSRPSWLLRHSRKVRVRFSLSLIPLRDLRRFRNRALRLLQ